MADRNIATRPRRSAAIEAQAKVEEFYEIWGQPPSENKSKRPTPGRKGSEASTARKRRRTSIQKRDEFRLPTVLPTTEAENEISTHPAKRGREQPRKNLVHRSTLEEIQQPTKKITLSVPNSLAFKEALCQIWDTGGDARHLVESRTSGHVVCFDDILDERVTNFSTQGAIFDTIAEAQSGSVPPKIFISNLAERRPSSNVRSDSTFRNVDPDILHSGTQIHQSSPRAGMNAASPSEEQTEFDPIDWELEGTPSKPESPKWESDYGRWLQPEQQETAIPMRETEHLGSTSFAGTPSFNREHTHSVRNPSSSAIKQPLNFATSTKHDRVMSTLMLGKQQKPEQEWEPSADKEATSKLAAEVVTSSSLRDWTGVLNEYAVRTLPGILAWPRATDEDVLTKALHGYTMSSNASSSEVQGAQALYGDKATPVLTCIAAKPSEAKDATMQTPLPKPSEHRSDLPEKVVQQSHERGDDGSISVHEPIYTTTEIVGKTRMTARGDQGFILKRKPLSFHPPPMNLQTPNIYFDRHPQGSSIGAHSIDPLVGLPDHSDPRTFHARESKDQAHVLAALKPTVDHFQQLTGGAEPLDVPLDSGYEVAHSLLQAHLRLWFVVNRPDFAHKNAIPKLFRLERWEGGVEDWKYASNSPVGFIFHNATLG